LVHFKDKVFNIELLEKHIVQTRSA